jgi:acyl carrier protein
MVMTGFSNRTEVAQSVVAVVNKTIRDWDVDLPNGVDSETQLMRDLNFESIDVVQFAVAIEQAAGRKGNPRPRSVLHPRRCRRPS